MKRTLYFGNEAYLSTQKGQLAVTYPNSDEKKTVPIEDIGIVLLDHYQLTSNKMKFLIILNLKMLKNICDRKTCKRS